eukprot:TRINITY_DN3168_c2_g1_i1.p1 TRINITY_DN3168_c2_g1~~TRINITY_DN3168_c2_g1_i1.p1  ORF type:complete len:814 (+),score=308.22 TRINITY_DN3168_c2_g1_i1:142-2583(+)
MVQTHVARRFDSVLQDDDIEPRSVLLKRKQRGLNRHLSSREGPLKDPEIGQLPGALKAFQQHDSKLEVAGVRDDLYDGDDLTHLALRHHMALGASGSFNQNQSPSNLARLSQHRDSVHMTQYAYLDTQASRWGPLRPGTGSFVPFGVAKPPQADEYAPCLGIDLGTTTACVAAWNGQKAVVLRSFQYSDTFIPAVVAFSEKDTLVGHAAEKQWPQNPHDTVYSAKRWIGRKFDTLAEEDSQNFLYKVRGNEHGNCCFDVANAPSAKGLITPEQVSSLVLEHVKDIAIADHLRRDVRDAVITVPASFTDEQKESTRKAGELAGLRVLMVLTEPTAAAIACGIHGVKADENLWQRKNILVFDLGGGTLDVSVMYMDGKQYQILSTGGDENLGGETFDLEIFEYFRAEISKKFPTIPKADDGLVQLTVTEEIRLLHKSREVKEALSGIATQTFEIEIAGNIFLGSLTRARMDSLCSKLVSHAVKKVEEVLKESGLHRGSIDDVVLVGGAVKMKKIQDSIENFFKGFKAFIVRTDCPDEINAQGAAIKAATMLEVDSRVPPPSLPLISDVVPQTIGVAMKDDQYCVVIPRNTSIPASQQLERYFVYHTTEDNQTAMQIAIYQGEATRASDNFFLGSCTIEGLPTSKAGEIDICVKYVFNQSGVLEVVGWVQGQGHISSALQVTDSAYERHRIGGIVAKPSLSRLVTEPNSAAQLQLGGGFFVPPGDVPKDREDRRIDEERLKEYTMLKDQKRKEKKEAKEKQKREREERERQMSISARGSHSHRGSQASVERRLYVTPRAQLTRGGSNRSIRSRQSR